MTSIIIKKLDHYQNTQSHYQIDDLTIHLSLDKICCKHVYLSQDDEILILHKEILVEMMWVDVSFRFENPHRTELSFSDEERFGVGFTVDF